MSKAILLIDIGSTYTKVTAVDLDNEIILGTAKAFTTVLTDINEGIEAAVCNLHSMLGKMDYTFKYACSSAAGGLKMVAVGLVPDLTVEAAKRAALSAGAKVMKTYAYELSSIETDEINGLRPDIILLSGGTDGGNKNAILHNARMISEIECPLCVVAAGNKSVAPEILAILKSKGKETVVCENVMPQFNILNIEPAREVIREIFLKRIITARGLTKVQALIQGILMPTPSAVLKAVELLSTGYGKEKGVGDLVAVDVGGATTDVYSIADGKPSRSGVIEKGLPEPFAKRTVEGDLGVRYSARALLEAVGLDSTAEAAGLTEAQILHLVDKIEKEPYKLPKDEEKIGILDYGLACMAVKHAVERHTGRIEVSYTPFGASYLQTGKDLTRVKMIIGTGGPVINSINPEGVLKKALFEEKRPFVLKPENAELLVDRKYILAAMGLLSEKFPETAVRIMKKEFGMV